MGQGNTGIDKQTPQPNSNERQAFWDNEVATGKISRLVDLTTDLHKGESLLELTLSNQYFQMAKFFIQSGADISRLRSFNLTFQESVTQEIERIK